MLAFEDLSRLRCTESLGLKAVDSVLPRVLVRRGLSPGWSLRRATETIFYDALDDVRSWRKGPNSQSLGNALTVDGDGDDQQWLWLSGGTDWQAFQGCFRCFSEAGVRPSWITFRMRIATPEISGACLALCASQHMWGFTELALVVGFCGTDASNVPCFTLQTDVASDRYVGANNLLHKGCPLPMGSPSTLRCTDRPFDIAVHLDWGKKKASLFVDGSPHIWRVPFKARTPVRFIAFYNWRKDARTAFSELAVGDHRPDTITDRSIISELERPSILQRCCSKRKGSRRHGFHLSQRAIIFHFAVTSIAVGIHLWCHL